MGNRLSLLLGPVVVVLYAAVMVLTTAVWDPLAAVPALTYPEIVAGLTAAGVDLTAAVVGLIGWGALGVGLAAALTVLGFTGTARPGAVVRGHLALIAAGAPAYFFGAFSLRVDIADTFGVSGGDHTPVGGALYTVSGVAVLALVGVGVRRAGTRRQVLL